ncbi:type II toxin-antitoxin system Phd/YefM family antitoxin [Microbacterium sp. 179-I 3D3 NHS]|uniref:type II toxin-antitoxin system Phd/YefM family antitoxin n=1 Tax=unclassified Microbacterium TaxID=2609290 RepID=UPI0039A2A765
MKIISQRELRNDNAGIIDEVERGETFTVTRRGTPVASLAPYAAEAGLRCVKPARHRLDPTKLRRSDIATPTAEVLDDLRGER